MSLIEQLYQSEALAEPIGDGADSTEDAEGNFLYEKLMEEIEALFPPNEIKRQLRFCNLLGGVITTKAEREYKRGICFAVRFMAEAMQPQPKTYSDFQKHYDALIG